MDKWRKITIYLAIQVLFILIIAIPCSHAISVSIKPVELNLRPGEKYTGSIQISNDSEEIAYLKISLGDWRQVGENEQYLEVGGVEHSISQWMQISPFHLAIRSGDWGNVHYEIKVPDNPKLSGSYWGIIFVEEEKRQSTVPAANKSKSNLGINIVFRHGIKIYTTFPDTDKSKAEFVAAETVPTDNGGLDFVATLENQGNTYLRPFVWLELRDESGATVQKVNHHRQTVLPGIKRNYKFALHELDMKPGRYTALIIADYNAPLLIAAQAEIDVVEE